jgi:hypothetical protein
MGKNPTGHQSVDKAIRNTTNSLKDKMTPDDLAGFFKERRGVVIRKPSGEAWNHITDVSEGMQSLKNWSADLVKWTRPRFAHAPVAAERLAEIKELIQAIESILEVPLP